MKWTVSYFDPVHCLEGVVEVRADSSEQALEAADKALPGMRRHQARLIRS